MANALLSTVNAARQRQPMCYECERSLPNQIVFDKIESIIRLMQDEQNGLPVKTAKSFMSKIPSVFTGTDLIQWMMRNLKLEDQQEAIHLANLIASYGYIFPIEDHTLSIKNDCTFYRFQTPCLWPSNNGDPENTDYAVYLCKRTMQGKTRLELADYEAENLARLQKMFSRKWEFIFMQAESQAKVDKKRDKLERKVLDSQERAFWDVYRPVPGCVNTTELDIKKACRLSKSAKRCGECQKVAVAQSGGATGGAGTAPGTGSSVLIAPAAVMAVAAAAAAAAISQSNSPVPNLLELSLSKDTKTNTPAPVTLMDVPRQQQQQLMDVEPIGERVGATGGGGDRSSSENVTTDDIDSSPSKTAAPSDISKLNNNNNNNKNFGDDRVSPEVAETSPSGAAVQQEQRAAVAPAGAASASAPAATSCKGTSRSDASQRKDSELKRSTSSGKPSPGIGGHQHNQPQQAHHHHHHHHHHHPHQHPHGHHHHHHHHQHHHHRQCPHHKHHQSTGGLSQSSGPAPGGPAAEPSKPPAAPISSAPPPARSNEPQLTIPAESVLTATLAASAGLVPTLTGGSVVLVVDAERQADKTNNRPTKDDCEQPTGTVKRVHIACTKKCSAGSVDQFIKPASQTAASARRKSECNRIMSMVEPDALAAAARAAGEPSDRLHVDDDDDDDGIKNIIDNDGSNDGSSNDHNDGGDNSALVDRKLEFVRPASVCCSTFSSGSSVQQPQEQQVMALGDQEVGPGVHRLASQRLPPTSNQSGQNAAAAATATKCHHHHQHHHHHHQQQQQQQPQQQQQMHRKSSLNLIRSTPASDKLLLAAAAGGGTSGTNLTQTSGAAATTVTRKSSINITGGSGLPLTQRSPLNGTRSACVGGGGSSSGAAQSVAVLGEPSSSTSTTTFKVGGSDSGRQNIGDLERELESLRVRLDRRVGGVKMSKATQSYLSYFKQWAEYDPFIAQPIPSNPWIGDSTELWDSERQTKDVHCRRVRRWAFSLKELLSDPAGREQFHRFLEKEFSAENLKFWDAVQELKRVHSRDVARRVEAIWTEFLAQDANCPINIDSKSYETSKKNMAKNRNNRCIFDEAAGHVYQLMKNDSYPRYLRSDMYKDYKEASEKKRSNQVAFDVFKPQITTLKHKFNF